MKKKTEKVKPKMGRPSKFETINMKQLEILVKDGKTDKFVCDFFDITESTLTNYKKKHPDFFASLKDWKLEADAEVEISLYERAKGYSVPEDKIFIHEGEPVIVPTTKNYPPDPTSIIFWLKNRQPDKWRDKFEHDHSSKTFEDFLKNIKQ